MAALIGAEGSSLPHDPGVLDPGGIGAPDLRLKQGLWAMALSSSDLLGTNCLDSDAGGWEYPLSEWKELGAGEGWAQTKLSILTTRLSKISSF